MKQVKILVGSYVDELETAVNNYIAQMTEAAKVATDGNVTFNVVDIKYTPLTSSEQCQAMIIYTHEL